MEEFEFEGQRPDEEIILVRKKHPWVLFKPALILLAIVLIIVLSFLFWGASRNSVITLVAGMAASIILIYNRWFVFSNDIYILTNQRIIDINQRSIFSRRVSETELDNVYNIAYEIKGIIRSLLNFGDVQISTVGDDISTVTLESIENPHFVQQKIVQARKEYLGQDERPLKRPNQK